ncbi:MAG: ABC transporter permease [Solirubrobacterales bacterium]|nr:ABC transporter permease [Solirubrobacterales bacterium]
MTDLTQPAAPTPIPETNTTRLPSVLALLAAQISYQARLLAKGRAIVIGVGLPVILLISSASHGHASALSVASRATFGLTLTAWNTYGIRLVAAREAGILKRWKATPLPRWAYFLARIVATTLVAVAAGAATVAVGALLYNTPITALGALDLVIVFILGSAAWAATATAVTSVIPTVDAAGGIMILIYFPVIIVSGVIGQITEPHWLSTLARYLPAQPLINGAASALHHRAGPLPAHDVLVLAGWTIGGLIAAVALFRWEPHRAQRRPTRAR